MERPNIIMVLLDGFRRDYLSKSKNLLDFANKNCFFSNMITASPYTIASLYAIFSGIYPTLNGVDSYFNMFKFRKGVCRTLTEYLRKEEYYCEADVINKNVLPKIGFNVFKPHNEYKEDLLKKHKQLISNVLGKKHFFLFLHYSTIHTNVVRTVGKKYTDFDEEYFNNPKQNKKNYLDYIKTCDCYVGNLIKYMAKLNLLDNTIIVFFSDHGVSTGEKKGEKMYGSFLYDYTLKIFSIMSIPGFKAKNISVQTRSIDILPTLLDLVGIEIDKSFEHLQGKTLIHLLNSQFKDERIAFSETGGLNGPWPSHEKHNVFSVRYNGFKIIYNKTPDTWEFYNLKDDPHEMKNLASIKTRKFEAYKLLLLDCIIKNKPAENIWET